MTVSLMSSTSIEDINHGSPGCIRWQQLYVQKDKRFSEKLVKRSQEKGSKALVLTIDATVMGKRRGTLDPKFFEGLQCPILAVGGKLQ